jgi:uncharacterized membrane protein YeaQ/YmgE (transglycosylase-associated protein family)
MQSPYTIDHFDLIKKSPSPYDKGACIDLQEEYSFPQPIERYPVARKNQPGGRDMLHLLWTALIGLIVGALAKLIMPGKDPGGIFITMLIGIAGAFLGTFLGRAIGHYEPDQSAGFLMSLVGALILLGIYHLIRRNQVRT